MTNENLVSGLGGPAGYGEIVVPRGDDNNLTVDLSSIFPAGFSIDGNLISAETFLVSTNGLVYAYDYSPLYAYMSFRPYYDDLDTRASGNNVDSGQVYVDLDTVNNVATFTWDQVGRFYQNGDPSFSFQMQLAATGDTEVTVTYRYGDMELDGNNYLHSDIGALFYTNYEYTAQSFETGLEDLANPIDFDTTIGNTGLPGVWEYTLSLLPTTGTDENDVLTGTVNRDTLFGLAGDDEIKGLGGADFVFGGDGDDTISGGAGNDTLNGDDGDDSLFAGDGNDVLNGDEGDDHLLGESGDDTINGGDGDDSLWGGDGNDTIDGGDGFDEMFGNNGQDTMFGGLGNDHIYGGAGRDVMHGNEGNDTMSGGGSADNMKGNQGHDTLFGGGGDDIMDGNRGRDILYGDDGRDTLNGGKGNDALYGDGDHDDLIGGDGADSLFGGDGDDRLYGNNGSDVLDGGNGDDFLSGGPGADTFMFGSGEDVIANFELNLDRVMIDLELVGGVAASVGELWSMATVDGTDTVFDFGNGNTLTFQGTSAPAVLAGLIEFF